MKLTQAPARHVGIQLTGMQLNAAGQDGVRLVATFALVRDDGGFMGAMTRDRNWSDASLAALHQLVDALEAEMLPEVFKVEEAPADTDTPEAPEEPQQF